jgi:hypothetical protein
MVRCHILQGINVERAQKSRRLRAPASFAPAVLHDIVLTPLPCAVWNCAHRLRIDWAVQYSGLCADGTRDEPENNGCIAPTGAQNSANLLQLMRAFRVQPTDDG